MASSIDASTSGAGGVITTADNSGTLQLKSGGTTIATISSTGLALNTGNITVPSTAAPAFSAYAGSAQNTTSNVYTKVQFPNEEFDTNNNFDSSTNYRFTPTVAGYYQLNVSVSVNGSPARFAIQLYKNGSAYKIITDISCGTGTTPNAIAGSAVVYFNGSTDYVELWVYQSSGGALGTAATAAANYFQASFVRAA
jgi:hypothetical protein